MNPFKSILQQKHILAVRRNHALEHATLNIIARRFPHYRLSGYSDTGGCFIFGEIPQDELQTAAEEALRRLNDGESQLAIHPYCGTNYVVMGAAAGAAAWFALLGMKKSWKDRLDRLSLAVTLSTLAVIMAHPLGPKVQKNVTTSAILGSMQITGIEKISRAVQPIFRIHTKEI